MHSRPNSGSPIQAMKEILGLVRRYIASIFGTIRRIKLERNPFPIQDARSRANQILLELQMTDELLERIQCCNRKVKSFRYRLLIDDPETEEFARVVTA